MKTKYQTLIAFLLFLFACTSREEIHVEQSDPYQLYLAAVSDYLNLPVAPFDYSVPLPKYLMSVGMRAPEIDNDKAAIGRVLFYDKNLSENGKTACANCHNPLAGFGDRARFSGGNNGFYSARNTLPLANVANVGAHYTTYNGVAPAYSWDMRNTSLRDQVAHPFAADGAMGLPLPKVTERVAEQPYYQLIWPYFYERSEVYPDDILDCLNQFTASLGAYRSKFDQAMENLTDGKRLVDESVVRQAYFNSPDSAVAYPFDQFATWEYRGFRLFVKYCSKCHAPIRPFQEVFAANNGLDSMYADAGLGAWSGNPADLGVFKAPSLRNIQRTAPYMHDGRFVNLDQVMEFYSKQVYAHPNLHPLMYVNGSVRRNFTDSEKSDLRDFLRTLTDDQTPVEEKFSNPFK